MYDSGLPGLVLQLGSADLDLDGLALGGLQLLALQGEGDVHGNEDLAVDVLGLVNGLLNFLQVRFLRLDLGALGEGAGLGVDGDGQLADLQLLHDGGGLRLSGFLGRLGFGGFLRSLGGFGLSRFLRRLGGFGRRGLFSRFRRLCRGLRRCGIDLRKAKLRRPLGKCGDRHERQKHRQNQRVCHQALQTRRIVRFFHGVPSLSYVKYITISFYTPNQYNKKKKNFKIYYHFFRKNIPCNFLTFQLIQSILLSLSGKFRYFFRFSGD